MFVLGLIDRLCRSVVSLLVPASVQNMMTCHAFKALFNRPQGKRLLDLFLQLRFRENKQG